MQEIQIQTDYDSKVQLSSTRLLFDGILKGRAIRTFKALGLSLLGASLPVAFWLGIDMAPTGDTGNLTLAGLLISLLFLLFAGLILEIYFQLVRIPGALLLRVEHFWNFASPGICIFLLTAEPLIRWSGLISEGPVLPELAVHSVLLSAALIAFLALIFIFPLFRGMNATFLLAAVLGARFLLLPASVVPDSGFEKYATFTLYSLVLSLLIFLFLQSRRRLALSPEYETFPVPYGMSYFAFFLIPGMVALHFAIETWYPPFPGEIPSLLCIFLAVHWWVSGLMLSRDAEGKESSNIAAILLLPLLVGQFILLSYVLNNGSLSRAALKSSLTGEALTFFAAFLDRDRDGNSSYPGDDPDDSNPSIRADFISIEEKNTLRSPADDIENPETQDRIRIEKVDGQRLLTLVLPERAFVSRPQIAALSVLSSNEISWAVRNLLHGTDPVARTENRSLLSEFVDRGFRTICTGNGDYFNHTHPSRLDEGCQILEPVSIPFGDSESGEDRRPTGGLDPTDLDAALGFLRDSRTLFKKYKEDRFFLWLHADLRKSSLEWNQLQPFMESWRNDFPGQAHTLILMDGPVNLVFIDSDLFSVASHRSRIGFYRTVVPAPWAQRMHEILGREFLYPMQSFGIEDNRLWVGNQMTGSMSFHPLPWESDSGPGQEAEEKRKIKNLQP